MVDASAERDTERQRARQDSWRGPVADAALVLGLPVFLILAFWQGPWLGSLIGGIGVRTVFLVGRGPYDHDRRRMISFATISNVVVAGIGIALTVGSSCARPAEHWVPYTFAAMGAVVLVGAGLSFWRRFLWGIPLAVLLGFATFAVLWLTLSSAHGACYS